MSNSLSLLKLASLDLRADHLPVCFLISAMALSYNVYNTAATPLNNAQPWWLFYACDLRNGSGVFNA